MVTCLIPDAFGQAKKFSWDLPTGIALGRECLFISFSLVWVLQDATKKYVTDTVAVSWRMTVVR